MLGGDESLVVSSALKLRASLRNQVKYILLVASQCSSPSGCSGNYGGGIRGGGGGGEKGVGRRRKRGKGKKEGRGKGKGEGGGVVNDLNILYVYMQVIVCYHLLQFEQK